VAKKDASKLQQPRAALSLGSEFTPLFNGLERPAAVELRKHLFETAWPVLEDGIQVSQRLLQ
jgi:origin recognition complex subunit 3